MKVCHDNFDALRHVRSTWRNHRDDVLFDSERDAGDFTSCASRAFGPTLEIDI